MRKYLRFSVYSSVTIVIIIIWTRLPQNYQMRQRFLLQSAKIKDALSEVEIEQRLKRARRLNEERQARMKQVCEKYNLGIYRSHQKQSEIQHPAIPQYEIFLIDKNEKITWCPIQNAEYSTWLFYFGLLGGYSEQELNSATQMKELVMKKFQNYENYEIEEAFQSTLKFFIVQHPFERLISVYKYSFENVSRETIHTNDHYFKEYRQNILRNHEKLERSLKMKKKVEKRLSDKSNSTTKYMKESRPSFQDFIRFLLDIDMLSQIREAWVPYYLLCTPCLLKYQIIAKVETIDDDQIYIVRAAGLQNKIKLEKKGTQFTKISNRVSEEAKKYFMQLSKTDVIKLFKKYKLDFELFGYTFQEYLKIAG